jgi:hypothetical protein
LQECTACKHPKRPEIDAALVAGTPSLRNIAEQVGLSTPALFRHKAHIPAALAKAKHAAEVAQADTLLQRVESLIAQARDITEKALAANEFAAAIRGLGEVRQCLELLGELSGELQRGDDVNVAVAVSKCPSCAQRKNLAEMSDEELKARRLGLISFII